MAFSPGLAGGRTPYRHLREFDRLGDDLKVIERDVARSAFGDEGVKRCRQVNEFGLSSMVNVNHVDFL
jgi:hypothetical protein